MATQQTLQISESIEMLTFLFVRFICVCMRAQLCIIILFVFLVTVPLFGILFRSIKSPSSWSTKKKKHADGLEQSICSDLDKTRMRFFSALLTRFHISLFRFDNDQILFIDYCLLAAPIRFLSLSSSQQDFFSVFSRNERKRSKNIMLFFSFRVGGRFAYTCTYIRMYIYPVNHFRMSVLLCV